VPKDGRRSLSDVRPAPAALVASAGGLMTTRRMIALCAMLGAVVLSGCTLPGVTSPTPFTFPTPNLTLTMIFAPTATSTPAPPTPLPTEPSPTVIATGAANGPPGPSPTGDPRLRPNGAPVTAAFLSSPPTIDGDLDDWDLPGYAIDQVTFGAAAWSGTADASGQFFIGWDANHLYLAVSVRDDVFVQIRQGREMFRGDSVEFVLDRDLQGDFSLTYLNSDDYQIGLSPGNFDGLAPSAYRWFPRSLESSLSSAEVQAVRTAAGYDLEARIPWSTLGVTAQADQRFGFAISISDNDSPGTAVQQSLVSNISTRRLTDPTTWGSLILSPTGK
jgi:hypothetical protein